MTGSSENKGRAWNLLFLAWIFACIATLGSLFFSEVMMYPPCALCWYQRICMYPLTLIFLAALFPFDSKVLKFSAPLVIIGWLIASYHNLLYYGIIPESAAPCVPGASCTDVHFEYISIPQMSWIAFTVIGVLLYFTKRSIHEK